MPQSCDDECREGEDVLVTGWPVTKFIGRSCNLEKETTEIVPRSRCGYLYNGLKPVNDGMTCINYLSSGGIPACQGAPPTPPFYAMVCYRNGYFQLDGITSWAADCGYRQDPAVFSRVCQVLDWIASILD